MDIVIHGTKGGRKIFTPNKLAGLLDVNSDSPKATAIGQKAYAIRFTEDNIIFSQYKIIRDVRGDKRTGFVGFSLFIQKNKKFKGSEIVTLLDSVSDEYCQRYIADNNLSEVTENWDFLDIILSEYKTTPQLNEENFQSGVKDDAFIYFNGSEELKSFFDAPYQVEYQPFRQILFINKELEGKPENPLNALRNSGIDLTGKIDLENPKYKLVFNSNAGNGVRITVKANGTTISNNNKFRRKDELEISWTKQYYKTEIQRGKCFELTDKFIIIDKEAGIVTIKEIELEPDEKTITFEIKDSLGNLINDAEILISNSLDNKFKPQEWKKINSANVITPFIGENLVKSWIVTVKKGENLISEPHRIDFEKDCVGNVELILKPIKKVAFFAVEAQNEGNNIPNIKIWLSNKGYQDGSEIVFRGDEIEKKWIIKVSHNDYEEETITDYYPSTGKNPLYVTLRKKSKQIAHLNSNNKDNELDGNKKGQKKKKFYKNPVFFVASIVFVLAISFGIWKIIPNEKSEPLQIQVNSDSITNYLQANELFKYKLNEYRNNWENHLREISQKQQDSIEESISSEKRGLLSLIFGDDEDANNSYEQNMNQEDIFKNDTILQKIDSAIVLREAINELNFEYLKKQDYSAKQKKFKISIDRVEREDYKLIKDSLLNYDISYKTLDEIANLIDKISTSKQTKKDAIISQNMGNRASGVTNSVPQINSQTSRNNNEGVRINNQNDNETTKIIQQLKGNDLKISELKNFQTDDYKLQRSISLYLDFWNKVKVSDQKGDFDNLLKLVKKDMYLNESRLKTYLNKICKDSPTFETHYIQKISKFRKTTNSKLNDLENLN